MSRLVLKYIFNRYLPAGQIEKTAEITLSKEEQFKADINKVDD